MLPIQLNTNACNNGSKIPFTSKFAYFRKQFIEASDRFTAYNIEGKSLICGRRG